jgi:hypothetical protein
MRRAALVALAALGPLSVGVLRLVLPYYTETDNAHSAAAVAAHPDAESLVLWLGLVALLTLVPGLYSVRHRMPVGRLREVGFGLATAGYLCLPGLLVMDFLLWAGASEHLSATTTGRLVDGIHPSALVMLGVFVPTHILGIVLIGVLALRSRTLPVPVAWLLIVSQPLHLTAVILGAPVLDLVAWSLTGLGMAWLAATLPRSDAPLTETAAPAPAPTTRLRPAPSH